MKMKIHFEVVVEYEAESGVVSPGSMASNLGAAIEKMRQEGALTPSGADSDFVRSAIHNADDVITNDIKANWITVSWRNAMGRI